MESFIQNWLQLNEEKVFLSGFILEPLTNANEAKFSFGFSDKKLACSYEIIKGGTLDFVIFDTDTFDSFYTDTQNFIDTIELKILLDKYLDFFISTKNKQYK